MVLHTSTIISRNVKMMFNSKLSSLIIILGPIILIIVTGAALKDNSLKSISASIYSDNGKIDNNFLEQLKARSYTIIESSSLDDCKSSVINSLSQVCIEFKGVDNILSNKKLYDLKLHVDFSKQRTVWSIIGSIQGLVNVESTKIRGALIEKLEKNIDILLNAINSNYDNIEKIKSDIDNIDRALLVIDDKNLDLSTNIGSISQSIALTRTEIRTIKIMLGNQNDANINNLENQINSIFDSLSKMDDNLKDLSGNDGLKRAKEIVSSLKDKTNKIDSAVSTIRSELISMKNADLNRVATPIPLSYYSVFDEQSSSNDSKQELGFIDYLFPSFIMFFVLFASLIFSTTSIIKERSSNAYDRNILSRASGFDFAFGNFLTSLVIIGIQIGIILLIGKYFVNPNLLSNFSSLSIILVVAISSFSLIGMFIGYLFNSNESAIVAAISLALIFLVFTPLITPVETLPPIVGKFVSHTPLVILENKIRLTSIFGLPLTFSNSEYFALAVTILLTIVFISLAYFKNREKEI